MTAQTYRYGGLRWWVLLSAGVPGLGFVVMAAIGGNVNVVTVFGLVLLLVVAAVWRARVVADPAGLTIVSPTSSEQVSWDDIATIEIVRESGGFSYPVEVRTVDGRAIRCFGLTALRTWPVDLSGLEAVVAELERHRWAHRRQPPPPAVDA